MTNPPAEPVIAFLLTVPIGSALGYALFRPLARHVPRPVLLPPLELEPPAPRPVPLRALRDEVGWMAEQNRMFTALRAAERAAALPVGRPNREPTGDVPPLYLYSSGDLETLAAAAARGDRRSDVEWSPDPGESAADRYVMRILANAAFLAGVPVRRGEDHWTTGEIPSAFVDWPWAVENRRAWVLSRTRRRPA